MSSTDGHPGTAVIKENILEKHAAVSAYATSAATSVAGWITLQDFAIYVGIATAIGTFVLNWYYKSREDKRQEAARGLGK